MSAAPVDVLAVMERAHERLQDRGCEYAALVEARAAVAELIEFVESVRTMTAHHGRIEGVRTKWFNDKATAALAAMGAAPAKEGAA